MAHSDYNCCAVCDTKMNYNAADARTKEDICTDCMRSLHSCGIMVYDGEELLQWMNSKPAAEAVRDIKVAVGTISKCFYPNPVDDKWAAMIAELEVINEESI